MAFCTPAQFLVAYDYRIAGQLLVDDDSSPTYTALLSNGNLLAILDQASGEILSFTRRGNIYSEDDLNNLTGSSQSYLQRLTADVAWGFIVQRRGLSIETYPQAKNAFETLQQIANGTRIFNVAANAAAGIENNISNSIETILEQNYLVNSVPYFPQTRWTIRQS